MGWLPQLLDYERRDWLLVLVGAGLVECDFVGEQEPGLQKLMRLGVVSAAVCTCALAARHSRSSSESLQAFG